MYVSTGAVLPEIALLSHSGAAPALQSSKKLQLIDPDVKGKRIFIRVDFNVRNASTAWTRVSCLVWPYCSFQQQFAWRLPQLHVRQCSRT